MSKIGVMLAMSVHEAELVIAALTALEAAPEVFPPWALAELRDCRSELVRKYVESRVAHLTKGGPTHDPSPHAA